MSQFYGRNPFATPGQPQSAQMQVDQQQVITSALIFTGQLSPIQKELVDKVIDGELGFLPTNCEERAVVGQIFTSLDKTQDGKLEANDFTNPIPKVHETLQQVWHILKDNFDFNGDGIIEGREFLGYFVLTALFRAEAPGIPNGNVGIQYLEVRQRFIHFFQQAVREFIALMNA
jgi:hypothetical protein